MCTTWRSLRQEIVWRLQRWIRVFLYWIYVYDGVFVLSRSLVSDSLSDSKT